MFIQLSGFGFGAHCGVFAPDVLSLSQFHFRDREHCVEICVMQIAKKYSNFYIFKGLLFTADLQ